MSKKKSIKKHIKEGNIIKTSLNDYWIVTCLLDKHFQCKPVYYLGGEFEFTQVFCYTIDMIVFNEVARNVL